MQITPDTLPNLFPPTHATHSPWGVVVIAVLLALVYIVLGIRFYTRQFISKGTGLDDLLILIAIFPTTGFAIASIIAFFKLDLNRHSWDIRPELITADLQLKLGLEVIFDVSTTLTKLSMLALIYRVERAKPSVMRYVVIVSAATISLNSILFVFITTFQCNPASDYWTLSLKPQNCINEEAHLLAASIINTITDLLIVLIPIRTVMGLNLPKAQRIGVYVLFAGGCLASIAGAVRTYFTWLMTASKDGDREWYIYYTVVTSSIELFVGIICASIPATRPFLVRYLPRLMSVRSVPGGSRSWAPGKPRAARPTAWTPDDLEALGGSSITVDNNNDMKSSSATVELSDVGPPLDKKNGRAPTTPTPPPPFRPTRPLAPVELNKPLPQITVDLEIGYSPTQNPALVRGAEEARVNRGRKIGWVKEGYL